MKWRTKIKVYPEPGDERTITVFAWWPTKCYLGETVWLERVFAVQKFAQYATEYGSASYSSHTQQKWLTNYFTVRSG